MQGSLLRKPVEIANALADYYDSKIKLITQKLPETVRNPHRFLDAAMESWEGKSSLPTFLFKELSLSEVSKLISTLSNSMAMGHDRLDAREIKDAAVHLVKLIRHIVNTSLQNGKFAKKWKFARITPLLKNNELSKSLVSSYRPVAVLTTVSKITERAAQQQLMNHLEINKLMNPSCHAYRKMLSTTTTISEILDEIHEGAEEGKITQMMTLDQTAAFDLVNHRLLIEKLTRYGVGGTAIQWFKEYLRLRTQYVVLGRAESRMKTLECGVPQGAVIGPLLYALYTNDFMEAVKRENCRNSAHREKTTLFGSQCRECGVLTIYADDSTFTISNKKRKKNQACLKRVLSQLKDYLSDNKLVLNLPKTSLTEIMIQQKKGKMIGIPPSLIVKQDNGEDKVVKDSKYTRILGANIANNMLWNYHLESEKKALLPQIRKQLGQFKHHGRLIPLSSRKMIANGLLKSKLNYLMSQWGSADDTHIGKVQIVLNSIARWVTGKDKRTRIKTLMELTGWNTIRTSSDRNRTPDMETSK